MQSVSGQVITFETDIVAAGVDVQQKCVLRRPACTSPMQINQGNLRIKAHKGAVDLSVDPPPQGATGTVSDSVRQAPFVGAQNFAISGLEEMISDVINAASWRAGNSMQVNAHSLTSLIHSLIHSLTHSLTHSLCLCAITHCACVQFYLELLPALSAQDGAPVQAQSAACMAAEVTPHTHHHHHHHPHHHPPLSLSLSLARARARAPLSLAHALAVWVRSLLGPPVTSRSSC